MDWVFSQLAQLKQQLAERQGESDLLAACRKMRTAIETGEVTCDVLNGRFWEAKAMMYESIANADRLTEQGEGKGGTADANH